MGTAEISPVGSFEAGSFESFTLVYTAGYFGIDDTGSIKIVHRFARRAGGHALARGKQFAADSPLEGTGFEPSVPREAPGVLVASVLVRADLSACGESSRSDMSR